ncbi:MAG: pilus assembly protein PilM [Chloroflexi bacterium]|nr:pilus assembly protein PilM [Chloroflexota bacterium]
MFSKRIVTLNIDTSSIRGLIVNGKTIESWESIPLQSGVVRDGIVLEQEALGQAIDTLFGRMNAPRGKSILSLTGLHSTFRILALPKIKMDQMDEAVRRSARKEMPLPVDELYLTWQPLGIRNNKQEVFVLGVPREAVDVTIQALNSANVKPHIMDLKALALARVAARSEALLLDLEPDNFGITLVANGVPAIMRTFIPKRGDTILEDNVRRLAGETIRTVEFYNRDHSDSPLSPETPVFLTGEMAGDAEITEAIRAEIRYPISPLKLPFTYESTLPVASYAVNIGLALRGKV